MTRPNILLIVLDATRADDCSCYGSEKPTTPNLDKLAAEGVLYEQAITAAPWTLPAMSTLFTGLYPGQTGVYQALSLPPEFPTLAELLTNAGYASFAISYNGWLSTEFNLPRGFEVMYKLWQLFQTDTDITMINLLQSRDRSLVRTALNRIVQGNIIKNAANVSYVKLRRLRATSDYGAGRTLRPVKRWIRQQDKPWFAMVHYLEAHLQYKPPWKWVRRFVQDQDRARHFLKSDQTPIFWRHMAGVEPLSDTDLQTWRELHLAEVAYQDYHMGRLLDWLRESDQWENTCVIVVADHGESLGEHGLMNHQYGLYDTLLRVPLIIRAPGFAPVNERVDNQVQTLDLFRTILDMANVPAPHDVSRNLLPGSTPRPFVIAEYGTPRPPHQDLLERFGLKPEQLAHFERGLTALRSDPYKLIVGTDGSRQLFDWRRDPAEENDMAMSHSEIVNQLYQELQDWWAEQGSGLIGPRKQPMTVSSEVQNRLQALGYLE